MKEHVAVRATPTGFDYRVDVLGFAPQAIACHASGVPNRVRLWRPTAIRTMPRLWRSELAFGVPNNVRNASLQTQQPFGFLQQKIDILEGLVTDVLPTNSAGTIDQLGSMQRLTFEIVVSMKGPKHIVVCVG